MSRPAAKEWPLVAFTLLSQIAVGALWTLAAAYFFAREARPGGIFADFARRGFSAVIALLIIAAAFSFLHLGRPQRAVFVLYNWRRSWLSREIFFELAFLASVVVLAVLSRRRGAPASLLLGAYLLAALLGFLFLCSMSKLYMLRTVPSWRSPYTPLSFFLSALLLGPLAAAAGGERILSFSGRASAFLNTELLFVLAGIVLIVLTILLFTPKIGFLGARESTLLEFPARQMYPYLLFRLLFLAAAVLMIVLYHQVERGPLLALAFVSAVTSEILGRYLFYAIYGRLGV